MVSWPSSGDGLGEGAAFDDDGKFDGGEGGIDPGGSDETAGGEGEDGGGVDAFVLGDDDSHGLHDGIDLRLIG